MDKNKTRTTTTDVPVRMFHKRSIRAGPHFKVDWRQLSFYRKDNKFVSKFKFNTGTVEDANDQAAFLEYNEDIDNCTLRNKADSPRRILNSLDGSFCSGQLSAILGPSGAGKSTFLSALFGSKQESAYGTSIITWFDQGLSPEDKLKNSRRSLRIAFLTQHDHLLHHLTVYEALLFASKLKNPDKSSRDINFHKANVKRVAKMLKLGECLNTRCGKLSGGQYKRVSIGQELLSEPDIIILDEPTSGLDSMTCLSTIKTLKSIVFNQPMSIILTIHQPDSDVFSLFDHVYVIAQGGTAIYEGPPANIMPTLASVNLVAPSPGYNPARFILEQAFVSDDPKSKDCEVHEITNDNEASDQSTDSDSEIDDDEDDNRSTAKDFIRRSFISLSEAIGAKDMNSDHILGSELRNKRQKDTRPLLNIDLKNINIGSKIIDAKSNKTEFKLKEASKFNLINRLSEIQKSKYYTGKEILNKTKILVDGKTISEDVRSDYSSVGYSSDCPKACDCVSASRYETTDLASSSTSERERSPVSKSASLFDMQKVGQAQVEAKVPTVHISSPASSSCRSLNVPCSDIKLLGVSDDNGQKSRKSQSSDRDLSLNESASENGSSSSGRADFVCLDLYNQQYSEFGIVNGALTGSSIGDESEKSLTKLSRHFDKRLSSRNTSSSNYHPTWYHTSLIAHRTWLSIVRDPIFFGIQAFMHTTIPILLAFIFGSLQDEGCPRVGNFDFVEFAYSESSELFLGSMGSIRKSIGNVGIMFFQMFVLCFAINCITALVFPSDMFVLLKEYRNGWYSLRSYLFGRTLADLPVPIVLHSVAMIILYTLTGQPLIMWRMSLIVLLVILASLVAQSVGLAIGAILMKSSQSAVLAAAGIVAPFFALSGFIVRIHTLPWLAQFAAKGSYLYHLLNGFIILRYGFGRCTCNEDDFEIDSAHHIPKNLNTMASFWIGTFSEDYRHRLLNITGSLPVNRTNVDPNIDLIGKLTSALNIAKSFGHEIKTCDDVLPYTMLDFNLRESDIYWCFAIIIIMIIVSRSLTFMAIYYKIRSFS